MSPLRPEHRLLLAALSPHPAEDRATEIRELAQAPLDWEYLVDAAARLGTLALLGSAAAQAGAGLPAAVAGRCRQAHHLGAARALLAERSLGRIARSFRQAGIPLLVLKGVPLALEAYGDPGLRPVGDLDILVHRRDRDRALQALAGLGYAPSHGSLPLSFYRRHHFHAALVRTGEEKLPVELHWDTHPPFALGRVPEEDLWAGAASIRLDGESVRVPGPAENLLLLAQHLWRHTLGTGAESAADPVEWLLSPALQGRLIWVADLALLGRRDSIDWARIEARAQRWGLDPEWQAAADLLRRHGLVPGMPPPGRGSPRSAPSRGPTAAALAGRFPNLGRASTRLQLRPVLAVDALRYAIPGTAWIRRRYGLEGAAPARVLMRAASHAAGAGLKFTAMCLEALAGMARTQLARVFTPMGNCQNRILYAKLRTQKTATNQVSTSASEE